MKKLIAAVLLIVLAGGGFWAWTATRGEEPVKVLETATVERATVRKVLEATGIIKSQVGAQVKIGARATGVLEEVLVKVGDHVDKGQLVAVIDDREVQAKRQEALARLRLAQAKLEYAEKNLPRRERLVQQNLEPQDTLDKARQERKVARHEVNAARAALETLDIQLSYHEIRSPIAGVVSNVTAQEGETVVSGLQVSNLVTVLDPELLEMWIYVDETDVGRTAEGQPVEFTVDARPERTFHGEVDAIYPEPEIRDNIVYYRALVRVDRAEAHYLRPEMTTQCRIIVEVKDDVPSIPNRALKWVDGRQVVFVPEGDTARETTPELGLAGYERTEILSGLQPGDAVVTQLVLPGAEKGEKGI